MPTYPRTRPRLRFTRDDAQRAWETWRFNCGPASLCAVLDMTPDEIRPHLLDFERKGFTNPTLMASILHKLRVQFRQVYRADGPPEDYPEPPLGLMRVQWVGPWCQPGVPFAARYRQTHWVGVAGGEVFDVNAMCAGGWLTFREWSKELVPWLIREAVPRGNGEWWPTHILEVLH